MPAASRRPLLLALAAVLLCAAAAGAWWAWPGRPRQRGAAPAGAPEAALPAPAAVVPPVGSNARARADSRWRISALPAEWLPELAERLAGLAARLDAALGDGAAPQREAAAVELEAWLASLGPEAVPTLGAALLAEPSEEARRRIVQALVKLGPRSEEATAVLRAHLEARRQDPAPGHEARRALDALGSLGNRTSFDVLLELVHEPGLAPELKALAARGLAAHRRGSEQAGLFVALLEDGNEPALRREAAAALGKVRAREAVPALVRALEAEGDAGVALAIAGSLGQIGDPASIGPLERKARSAATKELRLAAAGAIARIGGEEAKAALQALLAAEQDAGARRHLERWIESVR